MTDSLPEPAIDIDGFTRAFNANQMLAYAQQQVDLERERWAGLRDQLFEDIKRPGGRWGIHGHSAVDDDYFLALEYVVSRMDEITAAQPANQPTTPSSAA